MSLFCKRRISLIVIFSGAAIVTENRVGNIVGNAEGDLDGCDVVEGA